MRYKFDESMTREETRREAARYLDRVGWPKGFPRSPKDLMERLVEIAKELESDLENICIDIESSLMRLATTKEQKMEVYDARIRRTRESRAENKAKS